MKNKLPKHTLPALFVLGGMLAGYLSYRLAGCTSGTCLITATPLRSMLYMGFVGWLLSGALTPEMFADLSACGGVLTMSAGFRVSKIKSVPLVDLMPALILVMPFSALWTMLMG